MTAQFVLACIVTIAGLTLLFFGCFIKPAGIIDNSILVAFGETCTFSGGLLGVDYHYRYKDYAKKEETKGE